MAEKPETYRRLLLISGIFTLVIVFILGAGIIPPVLGDTYEKAAPERAATAFGVSLVFHLLVAAALFGLRSWRTRERITVYIVVAVIMFVLGLALLDAGTSFRNHGPMMETAALLMLIGAAMDGVIAVMIVFAGVLRPKKAG